ncbi:MAG: hypothetical protein V3U24_08200 [Candidatus Neomarinimicrobiota bacterium]
MDNGSETFIWSVHPARERVGAAVGASGAILVMAFLIYFSFQNVLWSCLACVVMLLALNRFYFPSRFIINNEGITARYLFATQRYRWREVRRFLNDDRGAYLSSRVRPSRLDVYRGMNILFGRHREAVVETIRKQLRESGRL